jgi:hypothetical protein
VTELAPRRAGEFMRQYRRRQRHRHHRLPDRRDCGVVWTAACHPQRAAFPNVRRPAAPTRPARSRAARLWE